MPQDLALYEELTARQNLRYFGRLYRLKGAELATQIEWALALSGLVDRSSEPVKRFSGGMKRRLNIAAGLLHRPRLVILDEPTVGVDLQSRNHIFATIKAICSDHGMTVLYTSHYMEEVELLCQRVAILDRGREVARDSVDGLIERHGGGSLEIEFRGEAGRVASALGALGEVAIEEQGAAGGRLRLVEKVAVKPGAVVHAVEAAGGEVESLHASKPSLETVFLTLTGHRLRDEA